MFTENTRRTTHEACPRLADLAAEEHVDDDASPEFQRIRQQTESGPAVIPR
jgi:hypothetical protein